MTRRRLRDLPGLSEEERAALAAGRHQEVARGLRARDEPVLAGHVFAAIWDFPAAVDAYLAGHAPRLALEAALDSEQPGLLDRVLDRVARDGPPEVVRSVADTLEARGLGELAGPLRLGPDATHVDRARVLASEGRWVDAARLLREHDAPREGLELLSGGADPEDPAVQAELAHLRWDLGDVHGAALAAQRAVSLGDPSPRELLARALVALGHPAAAATVLPGARELSAAPQAPSRYRVQAPLPAPFAGAAYLATDRVTLDPVEIHLLLADEGEIQRTSPPVARALAELCEASRVASRLGHPAIRPVLRCDPRHGFLVLPRAPGSTLREKIAPPGLAPPRARALVAFLAEGLAAAAAAGLAHGYLLPSLLVLDPLGRPLLPPFGLWALRGLSATRTGTLEEAMVTAAPELSAGAPPSHASDVYALGRLWQALLIGHLPPPGAALDETPALAPNDRELLARALASDPTARPDLQELARALARPVATPPLPAAAAPAPPPTAAPPRPELPALPVTAAPTWSDDLLDTLCTASPSYFQPILDRITTGPSPAPGAPRRTLLLAPWPEGTRVAGPDAGPAHELVPPEALADLPPALVTAVRARLRPSSIVRPPGGQAMLALDDLLTR